MNVSSVSSATCSCQAYQAGIKQRFQDFKALDDALQSGDLSSAQSAFAAFQKDLQNSPQAGQNSQPFGKNSQAAKDFQALQDALNSGDVSAAQQAFASLKQDMKAGRAHGGHHGHHRVDNDGDADDGGQGSTPPPPPVVTTAGAMDTPAVGSTLDTQA